MQQLTKGFQKLPDPLTERTPLVYGIEIPIHIKYNKLRQVQIVAGPAPYGISTDKRITKRILQHHKPKKIKINPIKTALLYKKTYQSLPCPTIRETAQILGVSKGRVHQMLNLLTFDQRILDYLMQDKIGENFTERQLRGLLYLPIEEQVQAIKNHFTLNKDSLSKTP